MIEAVLWVFAWIVIGEIIYYLLLKRYGESDTWFMMKYFGFAISFLFLMIQSIIVFWNCGDDRSFWPWNSLCKANYSYLIWEAIFIVVIVLFFWANKKLAQKVCGGEE